MVHHEDHSSSGRRESGRLLLAVVEAGPLEVRVADKMGLAEGACIKLHWVVAPGSIRSASGVVFGSLDLTNKVI